MRLAILLVLSVITSWPCQATELTAVADKEVTVRSSGELGDAFNRVEMLIFNRCFESKPFSDRLQLLELSVFQDSPPTPLADLPVRFANLKKTIDVADDAQLALIRERAQRFFGPRQPKKEGGLQRVGKVAGAAYYVFRLAAYHNVSLAGMYGDIMSGDLQGADSLGLLTAGSSGWQH
jgi:hypothetical protein